MSIASFIRDDLIAAIRDGALSAECLTLPNLSKRYGVSATPVRMAVHELVQQGYLQKGENRRLSIGHKAVRRSADWSPSRPVDWSKVVGGDLIRLSLRGEPLLLREETTAEKYGISRSSIRQIFHHLAGRGILEHLPRRGWQLRPFRQADLDAYNEIRVTLELKALDLAWPRLVDEDLNRILDGNRLPTSSTEEPVNDNSLHAYLLEKAMNAYISDFFERHGTYYEALFDWEALDRDARVQAVTHHRAILMALLRRDRAAAQQGLEHHIRNCHPLLKQLAQPLQGIAPS